jgi:hypothetical protein
MKTEDHRLGQAIQSMLRTLGLEIRGTGGEDGTDWQVSAETLETVLAHWNGVSEKVARNMVEAYGLPNEATPSRLIWFNNGIWKRTIVYRDEVPHNFPAPHVDVLEQVIDYQVPLEKLAEIAAFDGSIIVERTRGEVAVRCDMEGKNILALNMTHEIVIGKRTAEDARKFLAQTGAHYIMDKSSRYTAKLLFDIPNKTADPDKSMLGSMIGKMAEAAVDKLRGADSDPAG